MSGINPANINEAFCDPIYDRKIARGDKAFRKYDPHRYTQPMHFPNYLANYTPEYPPPPKKGENYSNYPRSNLRFDNTLN